MSSNNNNNPGAEAQRNSAPAAHAFSLSGYSTLPARNSSGLLKTAEEEDNCKDFR